MRLFKPTLLALIVLCTLCFLPSCSKETPAPDLCADVECAEYGAECVEGECVCTVITKDYLLGSWYDGEVWTYVFHANGIVALWYHDELVDNNSYTLNTIDNIVYIYNFWGGLNQVWFIQDGWNCNEFTSYDLVGNELSYTREL